MARALSPLARRIRQRMLDMNIRSYRELENKADVPRDSVRHIMDGTTRMPRGEKMQRIAEALNMSVDELFYAGEPFTGGTSYTIPVALQSAASHRIGLFSADESVLHRLAGEVAVPTEPAFIVAEADNMEPTIERGDLVFFDLAVDRVSGDGIYMIAVGDAMPALRRVTLTSTGALTIRNDNNRYGGESEIESRSTRIAGRALGCYRPL